MAMDYPYNTVTAQQGELRINVNISVSSDTTDVTAETITELVRTHLESLSGTIVIRAVRHEISDIAV
ncbi:hypothetical protein [Streptomyces javensis]|uniref:Uncharacterized protein n=1 Tax=Streptomyces javensis TaxID=114698 RepID=A0ABN1X6A4_9ACTN